MKFVILFAILIGVSSGAPPLDDPDFFGGSPAEWEKYMASKGRSDNDLTGCVEKITSESSLEEAMNCFHHCQNMGEAYVSSGFFYPPSPPDLGVKFFTPPPLPRRPKFGASPHRI